MFFTWTDHLKQLWESWIVTQLDKYKNNEMFIWSISDYDLIKGEREDIRRYL